MDADLRALVDFGELLFFDEADDGFDEGAVWEKITVDLEEYRLMRNEAFKLHFRMSRGTFESLVRAVGEHMESEERFHADPEYNLAHVLLMVVWILATPDCFRSIALRFGKTPGVLHYHYKKIIKALSELAETYVVWPSQEERAVVSAAVERRTGFPGVVGAIDGCHIEITTPTEEPNRYFNRHHDHSVVLQAVADETLLFRDIYVGEPGSTHDSRVFRRSPLSSELLENPENYLSVDECILGDGAYILTDKVITPYRNFGNLTDEEINFNHRHASARVVIERAFGLLKQKWRRLKRFEIRNLEYGVLSVVACIVLHNFILLDGDEPVNQAEVNIINAPPREVLHLDVDDGGDGDHPNVLIERDHPLLANARLLGIERRRDLTGRLPGRH